MNVLFKKKKGLVPVGILLVVAVVVLLIVGIQGGLLSIFSGESAIQWQGKSWAYSGNTPALTADTAFVASSCSNQGGGCASYMRSDFDLSKYQEIKLLVKATTSAYINGNSASGSASAYVTLDTVAVAGVSSGAEERGGTNIPSDSDSLSQVVTLRRNGNAWNILISEGMDEFTVGTVNTASPTLKFQTSVGGNYGGGSGSLAVSAIFKSVIEPPIIPTPSVFFTVFGKIQDWFKNFFDSIALEISGPQEFTLPDAGVGLAANTLASYEVSIKAPTLVDNDFEDGAFAVRYCSAGFVRKDGTIFNSTVPERCFNEWNQTLTFVVPSRVDQFAVVAVMTENAGVYDSDKRMWVWTGEQVLVKEALNVKTKAPMPQPPLPSFFANLVQSFLDFIKSLFGNPRV